MTSSSSSSNAITFWQCHVCTFGENPLSRRRCHVCQSRKQIIEEEESQQSVHTAVSKKNKSKNTRTKRPRKNPKKDDDDNDNSKSASSNSDHTEITNDSGVAFPTKPATVEPPEDTTKPAAIVETNDSSVAPSDSTSSSLERTTTISSTTTIASTTTTTTSRCSNKAPETACTTTDDDDNDKDSSSSCAQSSPLQQPSDSVTTAIHLQEQEQQPPPVLSQSQAAAVDKKIPGEGGEQSFSTAPGCLSIPKDGRTSSTKTGSPELTKTSLTTPSQKPTSVPSPSNITPPPQQTATTIPHPHEADMSSIQLQQQQDNTGSDETPTKTFGESGKEPGDALPEEFPSTLLPISNALVALSSTTLPRLTTDAATPLPPNSSLQLDYSVASSSTTHATRTTTPKRVSTLSTRQKELEDTRAERNETTPQRDNGYYKMASAAMMAVDEGDSGMLLLQKSREEESKESFTSNFKAADDSATATPQQQATEANSCCTPTRNSSTQSPPPPRQTVPDESQERASGCALNDSAASATTATTPTHHQERASDCALNDPAASATAATTPTHHQPQRNVCNSETIQDFVEVCERQDAKEETKRGVGCTIPNVSTVTSTTTSQQENHSRISNAASAKDSISGHLVPQQKTTTQPPCNSSNNDENSSIRQLPLSNGITSDTTYLNEASEPASSKSLNSFRQDTSPVVDTCAVTEVTKTSGPAATMATTFGYTPPSQETSQEEPPRVDCTTRTPGPMAAATFGYTPPSQEKEEHEEEPPAAHSTRRTPATMTATVTFRYTPPSQEKEDESVPRGQDGIILPRAQIKRPLPPHHPKNLCKTSFGSDNVTTVTSSAIAQTVSSTSKRSAYLHDTSTGRRRFLKNPPAFANVVGRPEAQAPSLHHPRPVEINGTNTSSLSTKSAYLHHTSTGRRRFLKTPPTLCGQQAVATPLHPQPKQVSATYKFSLSTRLKAAESNTNVNPSFKQSVASVAPSKRRRLLKTTATKRVNLATTKPTPLRDNLSTRRVQATAETNGILLPTGGDTTKDTIVTNNRTSSDNCAQLARPFRTPTLPTTTNATTISKSDNNQVIQSHDATAQLTAAFSTAGSKRKIHVSKESLQFAERWIRQQGEKDNNTIHGSSNNDTDSKTDFGSFHNNTHLPLRILQQQRPKAGFQTAGSNHSIHVADECMQRANRLLSAIENIDTHVDVSATSAVGSAVGISEPIRLSRLNHDPVSKTDAFNSESSPAVQAVGDVSHRRLLSGNLPQDEAPVTPRLAATFQTAGSNRSISVSKENMQRAEHLLHDDKTSKTGEIDSSNTAPVRENPKRTVLTTPLQAMFQKAGSKANILVSKESMHRANQVLPSSSGTDQARLNATIVATEKKSAQISTKAATSALFHTAGSKKEIQVSRESMLRANRLLDTDDKKGDEFAFQLSPIPTTKAAPSTSTRATSLAPPVSFQTAGSRQEIHVSRESMLRAKQLLGNDSKEVNNSPDEFSTHSTRVEFTGYPANGGVDTGRNDANANFSAMFHTAGSKREIPVSDANLDRASLLLRDHGVSRDNTKPSRSANVALKTMDTPKDFPAIVQPHLLGSIDQAPTNSNTQQNHNKPSAMFQTAGSKQEIQVSKESMERAKHLLHDDNYDFGSSSGPVSSSMQLTMTNQIEDTREDRPMMKQPNHGDGNQAPRAMFQFAGSNRKIHVSKEAIEQANRIFDEGGGGRALGGDVNGTTVVASVEPKDRNFNAMLIKDSSNLETSPAPATHAHENLVESSALFLSSNSMQGPVASVSRQVSAPLEYCGAKPPLQTARLRAESQITRESVHSSQKLLISDENYPHLGKKELPADSSEAANEIPILATFQTAVSKRRIRVSEENLRKGKRLLVDQTVNDLIFKGQDFKILPQNNCLATLASTQREGTVPQPPSVDPARETEKGPPLAATLQTTRTNQSAILTEEIHRIKNAIFADPNSSRTHADTTPAECQYDHISQKTSSAWPSGKTDVQPLKAAFKAAGSKRGIHVSDENLEKARRLLVDLDENDAAPNYGAVATLAEFSTPFPSEQSNCVPRDGAFKAVGTNQNVLVSEEKQRQEPLLHVVRHEKRVLAYPRDPETAAHNEALVTPAKLDGESMLRQHADSFLVSNCVAKRHHGCSGEIELTPPPGACITERSIQQDCVADDEHILDVSKSSYTLPIDKTTASGDKVGDIAWSPQDGSSDPDECNKDGKQLELATKSHTEAIEREDNFVESKLQATMCVNNDTPHNPSMLAPVTPLPVASTPHHHNALRGSIRRVINGATPTATLATDHQISNKCAVTPSSPAHFQTESSSILLLDNGRTPQVTVVRYPAPKVTLSGPRLACKRRELSSESATAVTPVPINFLGSDRGALPLATDLPQNATLDRQADEPVNKQTFEDAFKSGDFISDLEACTSLGVHMATLTVNSLNAVNLRFCSSTGLPLGFLGRDNMQGQRGTGTTNDFRTHLIHHGCDSNRISDQWILNHVRWLVWKYAAYERKFAAHLGGRYLCFRQVAQSLKSRYDKEIIRGQRSAIRKVLNGDVAARRIMILVVSQVFPAAPHDAEVPNGRERNLPNVRIEVSDGWYSVPAILDVSLSDFVRSGVIKIGSKLALSCARLVGADEGIDPLDAGYSPLDASCTVALLITANATRLAKWNARLGFVRHSPSATPKGILLTKRISDIIPGGGNVPIIRFVVVRRYPLLYYEKCGGNNEGPSSTRPYSSVLTEAEEDQRRMDFEKRFSRAVEKLSEQLEADITKEVDEGAPETWTRMMNSTSPEECFLTLDDTEKSIISKWKQTRSELIRRRVQLEVQAEMEVDTSLIRDSRPFIRVRVRSIGSSESTEEALLTIWEPNDDQSSLAEGSAIQCENLTVKSTKHDGVLQLTATGRSTFEHYQVDLEPLHQTMGFTPRRFENMFQVHCKSRRNMEKETEENRGTRGEFDTVGFIVKIVDASTGFAIYVSDESKLLLRIQCSELPFGIDKCPKGEIGRIKRGKPQTTAQVYAFTDLKLAEYDLEEDCAVANYCTTSSTSKSGSLVDRLRRKIAAGGTKNLPSYMARWLDVKLPMMQRPVVSHAVGYIVGLKSFEGKKLHVEVDCDADDVQEWELPVSCLEAMVPIASQYQDTALLAEEEARANELGILGKIYRARGLLWQFQLRCKQNATVVEKVAKADLRKLGRLYEEA